MIFDGKNKNVVALDELLRTIKGVKFGAVQVIIQDGLIVQIDKTEKFRLKAERSERNLGQFTATHRGTSLTYQSLNP